MKKHVKTQYIKKLTLNFNMKILIHAAIYFTAITIGFAILTHSTGIQGNVGMRIIVSLALAYLKPFKPYDN